MACNSLHLTKTGLVGALCGIFRFNPRWVFLVSELYPGIEALPVRENYTLQSAQYYEVESSFAYHHMGEVLDHWAYKKGGSLAAQEVRDITSIIKYHDDHYWIKDSATVGMFWWERNNDH